MRVGAKLLQHRLVLWADWLIVLVLGGTALFEIWIHPLFDQGILGPRLANTMLLLLVSVPLAWRRRAPVAVLFIVLAATIVQTKLFNYSEQAPLQGFLAALLAFYSVAAHAKERRAVFGGAAAGALVVAAGLPRLLAGENPGDVIPAWLFAGAAWLMGLDATSA